MIEGLFQSVIHDVYLLVTTSTLLLTMSMIYIIDNPQPLKKVAKTDMPRVLLAGLYQSQDSEIAFGETHCYCHWEPALQLYDSEKALDDVLRWEDGEVQRPAGCGWQNHLTWDFEVRT